MSNVVDFPVRKVLNRWHWCARMKKVRIPGDSLWVTLMKMASWTWLRGKKTAHGAGDIQVFLGNRNGTFKVRIDSTSKPLTAQGTQPTSISGKLDLLGVDRI